MITKPSNYLKSDSRFRSWAKLVSPADIDLSQSGGYALGGQWVNWSNSVSLSPKEYLICAAETGSRANHSYDYRLIDGNGERVERDTRVTALDEALAGGRITEAQRVAAMNNVLYSFALYISLQEV